MTDKKDESVLVIPRIQFDMQESFQGFRSLEGRDDLGVYLATEPQQHAFFAKRSGAETNSNLKQLIPYVCIVAGDEIFVYDRSKSGTEERLHSQVSIGLGGHINDEDGQNPYQAFVSGTLREIQEEVGLTLAESDLLNSVMGLVNDDSNPVGEVHLGVCIRIYVDPQLKDFILSHCEDAIANPRFIPMTQLEDMEFFGTLETWSKFFAAGLIERVSRNGKWKDEAFRERVGMLGVCASNLASAASTFLLSESPAEHMDSKANVEKMAANTQVMIAGLIANSDIEGHLVKSAGHEFHEKELPNLLRHQS